MTDTTTAAAPFIITMADRHGVFSTVRAATFRGMVHHVIRIHRLREAGRLPGGRAGWAFAFGNVDRADVGDNGLTEEQGEFLDDVVGALDAHLEARRKAVSQFAGLVEALWDVGAADDPEISRLLADAEPVARRLSARRTPDWIAVRLAEIEDHDGTATPPRRGPR